MIRRKAFSRSVREHRGAHEKILTKDDSMALALSGWFSSACRTAVSFFPSQLSLRVPTFSPSQPLLWAKWAKYVGVIAWPGLGDGSAYLLLVGVTILLGG